MDLNELDNMVNTLLPEESMHLHQSLRDGKVLNLTDWCIFNGTPLNAVLHYVQSDEFSGIGLHHDADKDVWYAINKKSLPEYLKNGGEFPFIS